jgi:uncharacterized membrane protein
MDIQLIATYAMSALMVMVALFSWFLLLRGRFKVWFFPPIIHQKNAGIAFFIQSLFLLFAAFISLMRFDQLQNEHSDNVIENMIYGLSSLLLFRVIGDFKTFGIFGSEAPQQYAKVEKRLYIPLFLVLFILSLFLVVG